jgi:transposase-like protein
MKTTRKRYSAEFKAKVAMEAIRGDLTLAELAAKHGVHHTMIGAWKRQAQDDSITPDALVQASVPEYSNARLSL